MANIPDVLVAASDVYSLLLENDKVRVMEIRLKPGQKASMHNHPNDHVIYVVKDAQLTLMSPDGTKTPVDLKAGKGLWLEAGAHAAENTGKTDVHNVVIEIKK